MSNQISYRSVAIPVAPGREKTVYVSSQVSSEHDEAIKNYEPLRLHLERLGDKFSDAKIMVNHILFFPNGKPGRLHVHATYTNPVNGLPGNYTYMVSPDQTDTMCLFKITASLATRRDFLNNDPWNFYILATVEPRIGREDTATIGYAAGNREDKESGRNAALREWAEETGLDAHVAATKHMTWHIEHQNPANGAPGDTSKHFLAIKYFELDLDRKVERDFWEGFSGRSGGLRDEGEDITTRMISVGDFASIPTMQFHFQFPLMQAALAFKDAGDDSLLLEIVASQGHPIRNQLAAQIKAATQDC